MAIAMTTRHRKSDDMQLFSFRIDCDFGEADRRVTVGRHARV
jgi:hypothetical protein